MGEKYSQNSGWDIEQYLRHVKVETPDPEIFLINFLLLRSHKIYLTKLQKKNKSPDKKEQCILKTRS